MIWRDPSDEERSLLLAVIVHHSNESEKDKFIIDLNSVVVADMQDGGMNSLRLAVKEPNGEIRSGDRFSRAICDLMSSDVDGIPVSLVINLDEDSNLFELDIWRVDYSPLHSVSVLKNNLRTTAGAE